MLGIDGERDQSHIGRSGGGDLHAAHLRAHHGARTRAVGIDEVGHPDMPRERFAVEGLAGLRSELEGRDLAENGKGLGYAAGGQQ